MYHDFEEPNGRQNDHWTSTHQRYLKSIVAGQRPITQNLEDTNSYRTESQEQYLWKIQTPTIASKPTVKEMHFMKSFEETRLRRCPKLKPQVPSVSQSNFQWKSKAFEEHLSIMPLATEVQVDKNLSINFDRCKYGFGKLLDPSATTNNLAYRSYSTEESKGTTSTNIITFWNWKDEFKKVHAVCSPTDRFSNRGREQRIPLKHVPNNGLTTELRSNYVQPSKFTKFYSPSIGNHSIDYVGVPNEKMSENTIYGSGIRIQKYLA